MTCELLVGIFCLACIGIVFGAGLSAWKAPDTPTARMMDDIVLLWRTGQLTAEQATLKLIATGEFPAARAVVDPLYINMRPAIFMRILDRRLTYAQTQPARKRDPQKPVEEKARTWLLKPARRQGGNPMSSPLLYTSFGKDRPAEQH